MQEMSLDVELAATAGRLVGSAAGRTGSFPAISTAITWWPRRRS
jgi:hypothetical protein